MFHPVEPATRYGIHDSLSFRYRLQAASGPFYKERAVGNPNVTGVSFCYGPWYNGPTQPVNMLRKARRSITPLVSPGEGSWQNDRRLAHRGGKPELGQPRAEDRLCQQVVSVLGISKRFLYCPHLNVEIISFHRCRDLPASVFLCAEPTLEMACPSHPGKVGQTNHSVHLHTPLRSLPGSILVRTRFRFP